MIEVPLQDFELRHPALTNDRWWGKSVQWWQEIEFIEDTPKEKLDLVENNLWEFLDIISIHYKCFDMKKWVKDFEIVGSCAFNNRKWWSDIDFQMSCEDEVNQRKLMSIIKPELHSYYLPQVGALSKYLRIATEVRFGEWKNKQYAECYSLRDRKLYNREPHTKMDSNFHRYWDFDNYTYSISTRPLGRASDTGLYWDKDGNYKDIDKVVLRKHFVDKNGVVTNG